MTSRIEGLSMPSVMSEGRYSESFYTPGISMHDLAENNRCADKAAFHSTAPVISFLSLETKTSIRNLLIFRGRSIRCRLYDFLTQQAELNFNIVACRPWAVPAVIYFPALAGVNISRHIQFRSERRIPFCEERSQRPLMHLASHHDWL